MSSRESRKTPRGFPAGVVGLVLLAGATIGFAVVGAPMLAWSLVGVAAVAVLLLAPSYLRITAAVLAATCSRLLVATGLVSGFANFVHFPLALGVGLAAAVESRRRSLIQQSLLWGMIGLLAVALTSWLVNGGDVLRPFLDWLVFAEPILVIYALIAVPPPPSQQRFLWALALAIPVAQAPMAVYQALRFGLGDPVQGFFVRMGAGAHVAGAVSLLGSLVCIAHGRTKERLRSIVAWLLGAAALFVVAVLADAKQVIIAFLPALVLLVLVSMRRRVAWAIIALPILAILLFAAFTLYRPLRNALDWTLINRGGQGKVASFAFIAGKLSQAWTHWIVGLGPGNSVSRVAIMGLESIVKHDSPVYLLGLRPAETTVELWNLTVSSRLYSSSSAWSFISSWLGLLGDLGIAGFGVFACMLVMAWVHLHERSGWEAEAARVAFLMMILLAFFYSWLEEPGYTLMVALVIGLGSVAARPESDARALREDGR